MNAELLLPLTEEQMSALKKRINFDDDKFKHNVYLLTNWLICQKHLPQNLGQYLLQNFLIGCKGNLEKSKSKLERYLYASLTHKEFTSNRILTQDGDLKCLEYAHIFPLPKATSDGCVIGIFMIYDAEKFEMIPMERFSIMMYDYKFYKIKFLRPEYLIFGMEFFKPQYFTKIFTTTLYQFINFVVRTYPLSLEKIFIVSCHPFIEKGVTVVKAILPGKISNKIQIVDKFQDLKYHLPLECLPSDYGGMQQSLEVLNHEWRTFLLDNKEFFHELEKLKPTGPIPKKLSVCDTEYGIDGSFRKLNVD